MHAFEVNKGRSNARLFAKGDNTFLKIYSIQYLKFIVVSMFDTLLSTMLFLLL